MPGSSEVRLIGINTSVPHSARVWDYFLGGKDNYAVDRELAAGVESLLPSIRAQAVADRAFLGRAVRCLVGEYGVRQFLDIGTGLPTVDNTHEVAQRLDPECRIVYVDNDPLVSVHARALLSCGVAGACAYLDADLREPGKILAEAAETLDFGEPVAVMLVGVLHHLTNEEDPYRIVDELMEPLPPGSALVVNHGSNAVYGDASNQAADTYNDHGGTPPLVLRSPSEIGRFFDGLELLDPGVVSCSRWRPRHPAATPAEDPSVAALPTADEEPEVDEFAGVAVKPLVREP